MRLGGSMCTSTSAPMLERPKATAEDYIRFREHLAPVAATN